jgi:hypothetical protein
MNMNDPSRFLRSGIIVMAIFLSQDCVHCQAQVASRSGNAGAGVSYRIAGTVVSSLTGAPLARARVSLTDVRKPQGVLRIITTESGQFEFNGVAAGKFSLEGARRGFLTARYDQHEQYSTAIVTGAGLGTENLVLRLTPLAFFSGTVSDEFGEPVRQARVRLFRRSTQAGMNRVNVAGGESTDDQGYYEFPAVSPGEYYVSAAGKPWYAVHPVLSARTGAANSQPNVAKSLDAAYPTTYYGGATEAEGATAITVKAGDRVQADMHLNPVPALHLIFHAPEERGFSIPAFQKRAFDSTEYVPNEGAQSVSPGVWEVVGIPAGHYTVSEQAQGSQRSTEVDLRSESQEVDTSHGEAWGGVKLKLVLPRGEAQPKQLGIGLRNSRLQVVAYREVDAAGEATFDGISPGKYAIVAGATTRRYFVSRTSSPGTETTGHDIEIAPGASQELTVYLASGVIAIEGVVKRGDKPEASIMVALIPKDSESHLEMFRRDQSDLDGTFVLRDVIPGTYTIVAIEDAWGFAWLQPGVLARYLLKGQNLTITESMRGTIYLPDPVQVQPR